MFANQKEEAALQPSGRQTLLRLACPGGGDNLSWK
jgi:hypothetical protein